jgi:predicted dithiol-disulfide oxidoreductase (DUF899 family)
MRSPSIVHPRVVSRTDWLHARKSLLAKEAEAARLRAEASAARRSLPMVKLEKEYLLEGPEGKVVLLDLFDGKRQLFVHHFGWIDGWDEPSPSCSIAADIYFNSPHLLTCLRERDVGFAAVCRAPWSRIAALVRQTGWRFPWYSASGSDFFHDFHGTLDESGAAVHYSYPRVAGDEPEGRVDRLGGGDRPGTSVFVRQGDTVFHAYSAHEFGLDLLFTPDNFLDLTP